MNWIDRYGPAFMAFHGGLLLLALYFGWVVVAGGSPVTPELYGPAVYAIPAIVWAGGQTVGAGLCVIGAALGGRSGGWCMIIGAMVSVAFYGFLAAAASLAAQGTLVQGACMTLTTPGAVLTLIAGVGAVTDGNGS